MTQKSWHEVKGYLHFDFALKREQAEELVSDPQIVSKHSFLPFIHYIKKAPRYQKDKKTNKLRRATKNRHIFFSSHKDGYIYKYYSLKILEKYNEKIKSLGLQDNVLAYRAIEKNGQKQSNIHMAKDVFEYIKNKQEVNVLCIDISSFFDNICPIRLKKNWCTTLGGTRLPDDHYNIYNSLTNFRYIDECDCIQAFKIAPRNHKLPGGSLKNRICSPQELQNAHKNKKRQQGQRLAKKKTDLKIEGKSFIGIPQGSAMSGLLSNIFMQDFDEAMKKYADNINGMYRRYSDDILLAFPITSDFHDTESIVSELIKKHASEHLIINKKKTERRVFIKEPFNQQRCIDFDTKKDSSVQYLGFTYNGRKTLIRNSSISKSKSTTAKIIRKYKKKNGKMNTKAIHKATALNKVTPFDNENKKGFTTYASRAHKVMFNSGIIIQIKKNSRYIENKIKIERKHKKRR